MGKLTTHVLDLAAGCPAAGMRIELHACHAHEFVRLAEFVTNEDGRVSPMLLEGATLQAGRYFLLFHVAEYFRSRHISLPDPAFFDEVRVDFGIANPGQHYHVPLLVSPWSYSTYRGS